MRSKQTVSSTFRSEKIKILNRRYIGTRLAYSNSEQGEAEKEDQDVQVQQPDSDLWAGGRQMLRQYLQEVGFTDTILDARSARLRALLGGAGGDNEGFILKNGQF